MPVSAPTLEKRASVESILGEIRSKYEAERKKRSGAPQQREYHHVSGEFAHFRDDPWVSEEIKREAVKNTSDVLIIGGGFGGLIMGAELRKAGYEDIQYVEIAGDFGGTWYWNRYPGAMCDVESFCYLPLLEELDYTPKHRYAFGDEILEHSRNIARHYNLYDKALFQTRITSVTWNNLASRWDVKTDRGDELSARYVIMACGGLSVPKLPNVDGLNKFGGHMFHTSRWDYEYTGGNLHGGLHKLADKRVGIIGTGATAVQVVPQLASSALEVFVFQRTPSTLGVRDNYPINEDYLQDKSPGWQRRRMENFTEIMAGKLLDNDLVQDGWTDTMQKLLTPADKQILGIEGEPTKAEMDLLLELSDLKTMNGFRERISNVVKDPSKAEMLKPWYRWACKRPCYHDEYLGAFNQPNVHLIDTSDNPIERFTQKGIQLQNEEIPLDCIVLSTGFEVGITFNERAGFEITGRDGAKLSEHWARGMRTFQGTLTDGFPNCFFLGSYQQSAGAVNAVHVLSEQAEHAAFIIDKATQTQASTVEPTKQAVDDYVVSTHLADDHQSIEFYANCTPGYYNAEGKAKSGDDLFFGNKYADGPIAFFRMLKAWRDKGGMNGLELK